MQAPQQGSYPVGRNETGVGRNIKATAQNRVLRNREKGGRRKHADAQDQTDPGHDDRHPVRCRRQNQRPRSDQLKHHCRPDDEGDSRRVQRMKLSEVPRIDQSHQGIVHQLHEPDQTRHEGYRRQMSQPKNRHGAIVALKNGSVNAGSGANPALTQTNRIEARGGSHRHVLRSRHPARSPVEPGPAIPAPASV